MPDRMNLSEMFRRYAAEAEAEPVDSPAFPLIEAQFHELGIIRAQAQVRHRFAPGERVQFKHLVGWLAEESRGKVALVYYRDWDPRTSLVDAQMLSEMSQEELLFSPDPDCLVMYVSHGNVKVRVTQSSHLEPSWTEVGL